MNNKTQQNPREDREQQQKKSLSNYNLEFLGYQHSLKGETPPQDLAHQSSDKKGYISPKSCIKKQQLKSNMFSPNQQQDFLEHISVIEKDILPQLDRLIKLQGYTAGRNAQLELLGLIDGIGNLKAIKEHWASYAYQKGYITGTNRFWSKKFGYLTKEEERL